MKIGDVAISEIRNRVDFFNFMDELNLQGDTFIVKPNWVDGTVGSFTEARVLDFLFHYLKGKRLFITESYTVWRNKPCIEEKREEIPANKGDLISAKARWKWIKEQDNWFLESTGIKKILERYNVEYINITEEVWMQRIADAKMIKRLVEEKYKPVMHQQLYSFVPQKLFDLKGATFINFSKLKSGNPGRMSASTKNMFGLIPEPSRWPKWHGENNNILAQSIADIHKIYRSIFNTVFIAEGIFAMVSGDWPENFETVKKWGQIIGGRNSACVDAVAASMIGLDYNKITYLPKIIETFGDFDKGILKKIPKKFIKPIKLAIPLT